MKELNTCAWKAAWIWAVLVLAPMGLSAQCEDVLVATGLVFSQGEPAEGYGLELEVVSEHADGDLSGLTTYRLYMQTAHESDRVVAAVGDNEYPLSLMPETSFYQNPFGNNNPEGISPAWISFFPDLAFDSWVTIGLDGPSSSSAGEEGVTMLFASGWESVFGSGQGFMEDSESGSGWTVIPWTATNTLAGPDLRVLLAQLTTDGDMSGSMRVQVFPQGDNENDLRLDVWFDTDVVCGCTDPVAMNYDAGANYNDGSCLYPGCIHVLACNFDPGANVDDGSCLYLNDCGECVNTCLNDLDGDGVCDDVDDCVGEFDACGICNGPGAVFECGCSSLPPGDCDCNGNQLDALGVCGGDCVADADGDGICDVDDDCVGQYDACGICNGPGQVYECGCANIPAGDCDCGGNQLDVLGVCGGDCVADADGDGVCDVDDDCVGQYDACGICNGPGQVYECGCANIPAGDCDCDGNQLDVLGVCGGDCVADADGDGVCDVDDDCVGQYDACGICNGPGQVYECGCANIPAGDCDCGGNQLDVLGVCGGDCVADADGDGVCDVDDDCVGQYDACGICNGPGQVYECGCANIPAGDCDCDGNQLDVLGVCGGDCVADADGDGVCDVDDDCVGQYDACGICNGPGQVYECGCANIPAGDCDCDGNQLDVLGVCGGDCVADADGDGVCDVDDDCVGQYDACGICNGPGQVYECGCANIPAGDCDCDGNQLDVLGVCGGDCVADADGDGVCDVDDDCVGQYDACGICNGPGQVYECGCANIPAGDCDCGGNQLDVLGVCGGDCVADADGDGVCDVDDDCVGQYDACGICNGPGQVYECGCANIPAGDCDCDGNQLDVLGVCGGDCVADADGDGVCDVDDDCVGQYDACGICNGPGQVYECGCANIPAGDCDCDGNQLDVLGVCGGDCVADADGDGVCDVDDDCVGQYDACGICNGPGQVYECGCANIPAGDCDCDGNQADAVGECGGTCTSDVNENGLCDADEGCTYPMAINYNSEASFDNGSCEFAMISDCPADIDGSGHVDVADLLVFLPQFDGYCQ